MIMKKELKLVPVKMDEDVMDGLERRGSIVRLLPSKNEHRIGVMPKTGRGEKIYASSAFSGGHMLAAVEIDNEVFSSFATHQENEEFLLLGGIDERPMYLLICLLSQDGLREKLQNETLQAEDFVLLNVVFNDPRLSFFVMKAGVPHGECAYGSGRPSTFYVTESEGLRLDKIDLYEKYEIKIERIKG